MALSEAIKIVDKQQPLEGGPYYSSPVDALLRSSHAVKPRSCWPGHRSPRRSHLRPMRRKGGGRSTDSNTTLPSDRPRRPCGLRQMIDHARSLLPPLSPAPTGSAYVDCRIDSRLPVSLGSSVNSSVREIR